MHIFSIISTAERPYLTWLKERIKTAEGRVNGPKYQKIHVGDGIKFVDTKTHRFIQGTAAFKRDYPSFEEMLKNEGVRNMLPFLKDSDLTEGILVYRNFPGSDRVRQFGCTAIGIRIDKFKL